MANGDQIKAMLRAYKDADEGQMITLALQIAAREAKAGHSKLAEEIRDLVDQLKSQGSLCVPTRRPTPIAQPKGELADLVSVIYPQIQLEDLVLGQETRERLNRVLSEQRQVARIKEYGLNPRRKLLLVGPPGTGKTMTASALASELSLPLFSLRLESLFTRFMGEAAAKLKLIFENIQQVRGVYLFDEFDSIGQQRATSNDVGETRRILNSFLQMVEQDVSNSVVIAATNHPHLLDNALFRRFDDVLRYDLPSTDSIAGFFKSKLQKLNASVDWASAAASATGLSYADAQRAIEDAIKHMIVSGKQSLETDDLIATIQERQVDKQTFSDNR